MMEQQGQWYGGRETPSLSPSLPVSLSLPPSLPLFPLFQHVHKCLEIF